MKNRRWSNNDKHLWPFTFSKDCYNKLGLMLDSGANDGGHGDCHIRFYLLSWTIILELPRVVRDAVSHRKSEFGEYTEIFPREYGIYYADKSLYIHYGAQTHDSRTDKSKVFFLPWLHQTHIRRSLHDLKGEHFWTEWSDERCAWEAQTAVKDACPKVRFEFEDFDGEKITATTHIEEWEWRHGTGWFKWLSWFCKPYIRRTLELSFDKEVGPEKGSWKGGTVGTAIEMLPGELHEAAFKRYCEKDHRSKYRSYRVKFVGVVAPKAA
jgi:hypothetical protein